LRTKTGPACELEVELVHEEDITDEDRDNHRLNNKNQGGVEKNDRLTWSS
jgi:hypothetical protein